MSVNNFIPTLWAAGILKERDKVNVAVSLCNRNWEGEINQVGDKVKILTVGDIAVGDYVRNSTVITPQEIEDAATFIEITESKYFAFYLDDVDKAQAKGGLMEEAKRKAAVALGNTADSFIYNKYLEAGSIVTQAALTSANIVSALSDVLKKFQINNVPEGTEKFLEVSPDVYQKMVIAKIVRDYGNGDTLQTAYVGNFMGFKIYVTNGIVQAGSLSHCIARTKDAISFADQLNKTEAYRPQSSFSDAIKGLHLYGAKVVRPKELIELRATVAAESGI